jgi:hypothetical protein
LLPQSYRKMITLFERKISCSGKGRCCNMAKTILRREKHAPRLRIFVMRKS